MKNEIILTKFDRMIIELQILFSLTYQPSKSSFDRCRFLVDVLPVEAKTSFQPIDWIEMEILLYYNARKTAELSTHLKLSLAPRPASFVSGVFKIVFTKVCAIWTGIEISNPSSPVYPQRVILIRLPNTSVSTLFMNLRFFKSTSTIDWRTEAAVGPCNATRLCFNGSKNSKCTDLPWVRNISCESEEQWRRVRIKIERDKIFFSFP